jgi:hypothetical protein
VFTHGTEIRRGGTVEVFSVGTVDSDQGVPSVSISVPQAGTKNQQSKKVNKNKQHPYKNQKESLTAAPQALPSDLKEKLWSWAEIISEKGGGHV